MASSLRTSLRPLREARGWTQSRLADAAGISRQSYAAIESGKSVPATDVSLRLARALGIPVDELFRLREEAPPTRILDDAGFGADAMAGVEREGEAEGGAGDGRPGQSPPGPERIRMARVGGRIFAYRLVASATHSDEPADGTGVATSGGRFRVTPFSDAPRSPDLVVCGCDPSFALIRELLREERGLHVLWLSAGSEAALRALARGAAHVAGIHLRDPDTGTYNGPWVERLVPFPSTRIAYARWEQAVLLAPGNPLGIGGLEDLARPGLRFINREPGSGSRALLEAALAERGIPGATIPGFMETAAHGHRAVADAVASGVAGAGIAIRAMGESRRLAAIPVAEEPYELVIPDHFLELPAVGALLALLRRPSVREQVEALGGYDASAMGTPA